ncbi:uncharacterized protein DUF3124 [Christiangramia gaetbulicola]|uniref:Uncharacterized protein DUF3124 n=1 Tax=Christiangramia gaetbulicola TaxID=703340 RepID=A0A2T6AL97_9FLAO|nr:DUF3124 domain-containing protein [Christiangramia gaetbulicola]PTX44526.1 uncharacterized protein DUF3124 [Christiangramia gaetbulicola]
MKKGFLLFLLIGLFTSCKDEKTISSYDPVNWETREAKINLLDSLQQGKTYLSVYSEIYSQSEHKTHKLTSTVSMRNMNSRDTIFIKKAEYFNTEGEAIRSYFNHPIYIAPLETVEIVVDETDTEGGTGANFIFEWAIKNNTSKPLFEGVMISTSGQQGLSFTTSGVDLN